jgi:hypothetical protein
MAESVRTTLRKAMRFCIGCGTAVLKRNGWYCDECYARIFPLIFDYDDD